MGVGVSDELTLDMMKAEFQQQKRGGMSGDKRV